MIITIFAICILSILLFTFYLAFIRDPNSKFTLDSHIRIVRRNSGDGNKYYPEYFFKKWLPFKCRNVDDDLLLVSGFNSVDSALDFINSLKLKINPEEEIMYSMPKPKPKPNT